MFHSISQFTIINKSLGDGTYGDVKLGKFNENFKSYDLKIIDTKNFRKAEEIAI